MGKKNKHSKEAKEAKKASKATIGLDDADHVPVMGKISKKDYEAEIHKLQIELVKMTAWIKRQGLKVVVIFEGRDTAGKGGTIKRITEFVSPRIVRVVALPAPTDREKTQWYFQRYIVHLPAAGEMVIFDRSWYNRPGVERVMGFCTEEEYLEFFRVCPQFEEALLQSGIVLVKYYFSVGEEEQERRFQSRLTDPLKRWKLSEMDVEGRNRWAEYSKAKDDMFQYTDTKRCPWYVVPSDNKRLARLNCIHHLLSQVPYEDVLPRLTELPPRQKQRGYVRMPYENQTIVPQVY